MENMKPEIEVTTAVKPVVSDEVKAATYLWKKMGQPDEFNNPESAKAWAILMKDCMGEGQFDYAQMKEFIDWVLTINVRSAEYMPVAKNPAATLAKNISTLLRYYKGYVAGQKAIENTKKKHSLKPGKNDDKPEYLKESGKQGYLEKTDL
jgi:hypothetical protein